MSANRPESEVVLKSVDEVVKAAEEKNGLWPELNEPCFTPVPERSAVAERRVVLWTVVGVICAVTVAAITRWDRELLVAILGFATATLLGLAGLKRGTGSPRKKTDDPRSKRKTQKRGKPP